MQRLEGEEGRGSKNKGRRDETLISILLNISDGWMSNHMLCIQAQALCLACRHRHTHTQIMHTHSYVFRKMETVKTEAVRSRHLISSWPRCWFFKNCSSTGFNPLTVCPPRRPLASQTTTARLLLPWWNLSVFPTCFLHWCSKTQEPAAANFNARRWGRRRGMVERHRDTDWWRETTAVGRREKKKKTGEEKKMYQWDAGF